ncbi:lytic murein transglycosylase [Celerinatantimonas diazotrophica]|uniref:Membrane-bound lytic murein transglycosylase B n=1 Tax=Celerinatantimonas diazotrophica TaxID=412034 RepID=A0A4R1JAG0_9GAMM|nr:lytic murein transglycosylase [Celerinatantimonas diazotrophica]TCK47622.1 membrane-bound lytic murein transglycosylase B [Celerinatantimonas diazotrophica]CAG9296755.1 Tn3 family transposase TnXax1 [Celerinatantimonas diazotrophica]
MIRIKVAIGCLILLCGYALNAQAQTFDDYVLSLKHQALEQGYSQSLVNKAFAQIKLRKKVIYSDKNQPEFRLTLDTYIPKALPKWKVAKARKLYKQYYPLLTKISAQYHVQPRFIVALWGIESNFGKFTGHYDVMSALVSLAYEGRRRAFFERQIIATLAIMKRDGMTRSQLKGSWAGAMGQVQFMPGTYLAYAVDGNDDGKIDLTHSVPDALASAANYLHKIGWRDDMTWGRQVHLPKNFDLEKPNIKSAKLLSVWEKLGVRRYSGKDLPVRQIKARLVVPDDRNGRIYLVYHNYETLLKWNRSNYFAITVGTLADRIAYPPIDLR